MPSALPEFILLSSCFIFHRERFIVTWLGTSLYIIDPVLGRLVAWYSLDTGDIKLTANTLSLLL